MLSVSATLSSVAMERQGMNSEVEAEGRVKSLGYKVRAASKESQAQRASQILDSDLRTHWSTGTNAKEWILLELEVRRSTSSGLGSEFPLPSD